MDIYDTQNLRKMRLFESNNIKIQIGWETKSFLQVLGELGSICMFAVQ